MAERPESTELLAGIAVPTVLICGGTGKRIVGRRADLIIVDDPLAVVEVVGAG